MEILSKYSFIQNVSNFTDQYKTEFHEHRDYTNFQRCKLIGLVTLFINLLLLILDLMLYKSTETDTLLSFYLFYSHILIFILNLIWIIYLKLHKKPISIIKIRFACSVFIIINLYWNAFMALINVNYSGQITGYTLGIIGISVCLVLTPFEAFFTCFISLAFFNVGLVYIVDNTKLLYFLIINSSVAALISYIILRFKFIYFLQDFINRKKLLESKKELEITNQKLKEYEKLRTDFFANISHELKTPINVISCAQQMMDVLVTHDERIDPSISKYLSMIKQNSHRLIRLIGNLIDITKIDSFNFNINLINTDIVKVIEDITMSVSSFIENKGLSITFDTSLEEKIIACDPDQIERIILNLLSNSVKFTEKGGSIFVNVYLKDSNVCVSIKDTGIGIPNDMKELIFDRFIQVDKSTSKNTEGSGIGLSLVKSLIEMHGGSIHVNSTVDEGSEFIVILPGITLKEEVIEEGGVHINSDCIKKINIEFSDIYD